MTVLAKYTKEMPAGSAATVETSPARGKLYQIAIDPKNALTGTVALSGVATNTTNAVAIPDQFGNAFEFSIAAPVVVTVEGSFESFTLTPAGVDQPYTVSVVEFD